MAPLRVTPSKKNVVAAPGYRGRWAPSPTGLLHLGSARTALLTWLAARKEAGTLIWRTEDIDLSRCDPQFAEAAMADLRWLGLDWDEGPDVGGPHAPYVQSLRTDLYRAWLKRLYDDRLVYPCSISRRELAAIASPPLGEDAGAVFPRELRPDPLPRGWWADLGSPGFSNAVRFIVNDQEVSFVDALHGHNAQNVSASSGDFVLWRRDGVFAYQMAVVVDDILMGITEVVRGADIMGSTGRQLLLYDAFGVTRPAYAHVPLIVDGSGEKLSKRHASLSIASLRDKGVEPESIIGYLAYSCGLLATPVATPAKALVSTFEWGRVSRENWVVADETVLFDAPNPL